MKPRIVDWRVFQYFTSTYYEDSSQSYEIYFCNTASFFHEIAFFYRLCRWTAKIVWRVKSSRSGGQLQWLVIDYYLPITISINCTTRSNFRIFSSSFSSLSRIHIEAIHETNTFVGFIWRPLAETWIWEYRLYVEISKCLYICEQVSYALILNNYLLI